MAGADGGALLVAFDIAAFKTREYGGFTPHVEQGVRGVRSLAVVGSKCKGTGFENAQMGQIQVAMLAGDGSGGGRWKGVSERESGEEVALLEGVLRLEIARFWIGALLGGLGKRVIFAEDLRKPACSPVRNSLLVMFAHLRRTQICRHL